MNLTPFGSDAATNAYQSGNLNALTALGQQVATLGADGKIDAAKICNATHRRRCMACDEPKSGSHHAFEVGLGMGNLGQMFEVATRGGKVAYLLTQASKFALLVCLHLILSVEPNR